jgi:hypothetical protein
VDEKSVQLIADTIMQILENPQTENETKRVALEAFKDIVLKVGTTQNTVVTNCNFTNNPSKRSESKRKERKVGK